MTTKDLTSWLQQPRPDAGLRFRQDDGGWQRVSYPQLAGLVLEAAAGLQQRTTGPVGIVLGSDLDFVTIFFGALAAGLTPCPLAPPGGYARPVTYRQRTADLLRSLRPDLVVTSGQHRQELHDVVLSAEIPAAVLAPSELGAEVPLRARQPELSLIQFTSGSSASPKPVAVTWDNLCGNVDAIAGWLAMGRDDVTATWLPLFHDMGLIGCLITPVVHQTSVEILSPGQFLRNPSSWVHRFDAANGATLTAAPTFGYAHAARRVSPDVRAHLDLRSWRVAIVGAERIDARTLRSFATSFAPCGFRTGSFRPAYGLAEATLAVAGHLGDSSPRVLRLDDAGTDGAEHERTTLDELGDAAADGAWLVSSGSPLAGVEVTIRSEALEVPDGTVGEIVVQGRSVTPGYLGQAPTADGILHTGDAGLIDDGELFVLGRMGDAVKIRARMVYAEDIEAHLATALKLKPMRCAVVLGDDVGTAVAVVVVESTTPEWAERAETVVRSRTGRAARVVVARARVGSIARTTSGKVRRRAMWHDFRDGRLAAVVLLDRPASQDDAGASTNAAL